MNTTKATQAERILEHLEDGETLTPAEARIWFGCDRLAARIEELRYMGHDIKTELRRDDNGKRYARYSL